MMAEEGPQRSTQWSRHRRAVDPTALTFAPRAVGTTSPALTATLTNVGGAAVAITNVSMGARTLSTSCSRTPVRLHWHQVHRAMCQFNSNLTRPARERVTTSFMMAEVHPQWRFREPGCKLHGPCGHRPHGLCCDGELISSKLL